MAELGDTSDPKALVPGDPEAIDGNVRAIHGRGASMELAGNSLRRIDTGPYWSGEAAEAFRDAFAKEPTAWLNAGDAFVDCAAALGGYAGVLRWAQGQATEAIRKWDEAQKATADAVTQYNTAVDNANRTNQANAVADNPARVTVPPFVDPGVEGRAAAKDLLSGARSQLKTAGETAAKTVRAAADQAPPAKKQSEHKNFFKSLGEGVVESLGGMVDVLKQPLSVTALQTATALVSDPKQFGKDMLDWDNWAHDPGRAIGHLVPDAVIGAATGGSGAVAKRGASGALEAGTRSTAREAAEAAANAADRPTLSMKYMQTASEAQRAAMDHKVETFNKAVGSEGFSKTTDMIVRDPGMRKQFLSELGLDRPPTGQHVDHIQDLQAGGSDTVNNMQLLDGKVNSSFGSQLRHLMDQHPPGTVFAAVKMLRDGD